MKNKALYDLIDPIQRPLTLLSLSGRQKTLRDLYALFDRVKMNTCRPHDLVVIGIRKRALSFLHAAIIQLEYKSTIGTPDRDLTQTVLNFFSVYSRLNKALDKIEDELPYNIDYYLDSFMIEMKAEIQSYHRALQLPKPNKNEWSCAERYANWERSIKGKRKVVRFAGEGFSLNDSSMDQNGMTLPEDLHTMPWFNGLSSLEQYWVKAYQGALTQGELGSPPSTLVNPSLFSDARQHDLTTTMDEYESTVIYHHFRLAEIGNELDSTRVELLKNKMLDPMILDQGLKSVSNPPIGLIHLSEHQAPNRLNSEINTIYTYTLPINGMASNHQTIEKLHGEYHLIKYKHTLSDRARFKLGLGARAVDALKRLGDHAHPAGKRVKSFASRQPEIMAACYFALAIQGMGGTTASFGMANGSNAIFMMHFDAMIIYFQRYKKLPICDDADEDRLRFVDIMVELFASHVCQSIADDNRYGCATCFQGVHINQKNGFPVDLINRLAVTHPGLVQAQQQLSRLNNASVHQVGWTFEIAKGALAAAVLIGFYFAVDHYVHVTRLLATAHLLTESAIMWTVPLLLLTASVLFAVTHCVDKTNEIDYLTPNLNNTKAPLLIKSTPESSSTRTDWFARVGMASSRFRSVF